MVRKKTNKTQEDSQALWEILQREKKLIVMQHKNEEWGLKFEEGENDWFLCKTTPSGTSFFVLPHQNQGNIWSKDLAYCSKEPLSLLQLFIKALNMAKNTKHYADFIKGNFYLYLKLLVEFEKNQN